MNDSEKRRDMTEKAFKDALNRHGFKSKGLSYFQIPGAKVSVSVSVLNAGYNATYREILSYLLRKKDEIIAKYGAAKEDEV